MRIKFITLQNVQVIVMRFNFEFFGKQEHRVFNYRPRYYDVDREALKEKFGHVDGTRDREPYAPGAYIKGSLRDGKYQKTRSTGRVQRFVGIVGMVLFFVILIMVIKMYSLLF